MSDHDCRVRGGGAGLHRHVLCLWLICWFWLFLKVPAGEGNASVVFSSPLTPEIVVDIRSVIRSLNNLWDVFMFQF